LRDKFALLARACLPFIILLTGVMIALYGRLCHAVGDPPAWAPSLALALIALIYSVWTPRELKPILVSTLQESTMLMFIIGMSLLYSYVMSYLHISQSTAAGHRRHAPVELGAAVHHPADGRGARLLPCRRCRSF